MSKETVKISDRRNVVDIAWANNGRLFDVEGKRSRLTLTDLVTDKKYRNIFKTVVEEYLVNSITPQQVISENLFQRIDLEETAVAVNIKTFGAMEAHILDDEQGIAKEVEPEISTAGYQVKFDVYRWGLSLGMTEKAIKNDQYGLLKFWLREASNALARTKEYNCYKLLNAAGTVVFSNSNPTNSEFGVATGRGIDGEQNGTPSFNDVIEAYSYLAMRNYNPDTMLMHPFAWRMFLTDPMFREVFLKGSTVVTAKTPKGDPFPGWADPFKGRGYKTAAVKSPFDPNLRELGASFKVQPAASLTGNPLTIIVTPRVPFSSKNVTGQGGTTDFGIKGVTDIIIADSSRAGIIGVTQDPNVRNWSNEEKLSRFWEVSEEYGTGIMDQGKGIIVMKDMVVDREYSFDNVNSVTLKKLNRTGTFTLK